MRSGGSRRSIPQSGRRVSGGSAGLWSDGADHGLRHRTPKRFPAGELIANVAAQLLVGAGARVLCLMASDKAGFHLGGDSLRTGMMNVLPAAIGSRPVS